MGIGYYQEAHRDDRLEYAAKTVIEPTRGEVVEAMDRLDVSVNVLTESLGELFRRLEPVRRIGGEKSSFVPRPEASSCALAGAITKEVYMLEDLSVSLRSVLDELQV